jgi:membrane protease YdiL (CAAX protease family)
VARRSNRTLLLPYLLPYVAYVAIASVPETWLARPYNYGARIAVCALLLAILWGRYTPLRGPRPIAGSIAVGASAGLVGAVLWIAMLQSLVGGGGEPWSEGAFALRLLAAATVVPVFEELLMRGYVLRVAYQWDLARRAGAKDPFGDSFDRGSLDEVAPGAATPVAVGISTLVFMLGHQTVEWPAAMAYGFLMCALWIARKDLLSCVVAHSVTNVTLALYVRATGTWTLW